MQKLHERDWRCRVCGKLLGKHRAGEVHLEYGRRFQNTVDGKVTSVCPKCQALNIVRSDSDRRAK